MQEDSTTSTLAEYTSSTLTFDPDNNQLTNTETDSALAGTSETYAIVDETKKTRTNTFKISYILDCSTETNSELDSLYSDWLTTSSSSAPGFTVESDGSLSTTRDAADFYNTETFQIRSSRTHAYCETNHGITYNDGNLQTTADVDSQLEWYPSLQSFNLNWGDFTSTTSIEISLTVENDVGLDVTKYLYIDYDCEAGVHTYYQDDEWMD